MQSRLRRGCAFTTIAALAQWVSIAAASTALEHAARDPAFFEREIRAFEASDRRSPPKPGGIVFAGSSSIRFWPNLREGMAPLPVIQRGFGGAHIEHLIHNSPRIIARYAPRAVVVFIGGNDIAAGKSPDRLLAELTAFVAELKNMLPHADLWLLSMKPSPRRWQHWPSMQQVDEGMRALARDHPHVRVVDTGRTLLDNSGRPDAVYTADDLHLNAEGYRRWSRLLKPLLIRAYAEQRDN